MVVFEDRYLGSKGGLCRAGPDFLVPVGGADIRRAGSDLTIVSVAGCLPHALGAADLLAAGGVAAEVIDVRTLVPLDRATILRSVAKTGRLVVVDYAHRTCGAAAEIAAIVAEEGFESLRRPIQRVTTPDVNIPFAPALEKPLYPSAARIAAAARRIL